MQGERESWGGSTDDANAIANLNPSFGVGLQHAAVYKERCVVLFAVLLLLLLIV